MYAAKTTQQALDALMKYFVHLEQTGYMRYDTVAGILGLLLVDTFLNTDFNAFVTEEDYNVMASFLYCLYGSNCLIPYPQFCEEIPQFGTILPGPGGMQPYRATENDLLRFVEVGDNIRTTEYKTNYWDN